MKKRPEGGFFISQTWQRDVPRTSCPACPRGHVGSTVVRSTLARGDRTALPQVRRSRCLRLPRSRNRNRWPCRLAADVLGTHRMLQPTQPITIWPKAFQIQRRVGPVLIDLAADPYRPSKRQRHLANVAHCSFSSGSRSRRSESVFAARRAGVLNQRGTNCL